MKRSSILVSVVLFLLFSVSSCRRTPAPAPSAKAESTAPPVVPPADTVATKPPVTPVLTPSEVVQEFGRRMKLVSTSAPAGIVAQAMREHYAGLVDPHLLDTWTASPAQAPGRQVSSPWPDRIDVVSSSISGTDARAEGTVIEATSAGESARVPIEVRLRRSGGTWLITGYRTVAKSDDAQAAVAVVHDYYDAIASHDFERAYGYWGSSGPPGQTPERFAAGFNGTASVRVTTGTPSRVEPAAGSRYVDVPVTILSTTKTGEMQRFEGTYTLRRTVVDGAPASERNWHLYRASIRRVS